MHLVDLLLIFGQMDTGLGVVEEILDFSWSGLVGYSPTVTPRTATVAKVENYPLRSIFGMDGDSVPDVDAKCQETVSCVLDHLPQLEPRWSRATLRSPCCGTRPDRAIPQPSPAPD